ncbi:MAG: hypothetical protein HQ539_02655 [Parcubacteria group bacterium]|nr:hypothetical protein [Parcubacteria group bacterium]
MGIKSIVTELCGYNSDSVSFFNKEYVKVIETDDVHRGDRECRFCWAGSYGQIIGKYYDDLSQVTVEFITIIKEEGVIRNEVGLSCDNLAIIKDEEQSSK